MSPPDERRPRRDQHLRTRQERSRASKPGRLLGSSVEADLTKNAPASGAPLPAATRADMESRLGHDFSKVRVHADEDAASLAQSYRARALTAGHHVVFNAGHFQPERTEGRRLIAHELTHVVQQQGSRGRTATATAAEQEAQTIAATVATGGMATIQSKALAGIQRQPLSEPEVEAPAFREALTTYGTYHVYPDNFIGPLPVADPTIGPWAIRETPFAQLQIAIESIEGGAAGITVEGDGVFKTVVSLDLAWLMTQAVGQELINDIVASGKQLTIRKTERGNSAPPVSWEGVYINEDGTPGAGNDVVINYNPVNWNPYGGDEAWMTRPPAIGLAHEMVHAWTAMTGIMAREDPDAAVRPLEEQATGLGAYRDARHTENRFRRAFGMPERPEY
jgi:hypothetical protein